MLLAHRESVTVDAPCEAVYAIVRDVTRTGEWSPTCRSCQWEDPSITGVGGRFTGHNVSPSREWTTTSTVVADDPGREFVWGVGLGYVRWGYLLTPRSDGGCELTHTWEFTEAGQQYFRERFGEEAPAQVAVRTASAHHDMPLTLQAIKGIAEREAGSSGRGADPADAVGDPLG
ncbi:SRPBCC family protein [Ornithinimicrobium sufpigmenti]|uniref:SRPBCC family protein n=1 Tax=Ornithinimicrobium sufpigmenti TaxID=2508882 RepID=UPI0010363BD6|nr:MULTISPECIES: SRPBCC family protein [unclassified Ornithinimicrobium]